MSRHVIARADAAAWPSLFDLAVRIPRIPSSSGPILLGASRPSVRRSTPQSTCRYLSTHTGTSFASRRSQPHRTIASGSSYFIGFRSHFASSPLTLPFSSQRFFASCYRSRILHSTSWQRTSGRTTGWSKGGSGSRRFESSSGQSTSRGQPEPSGRTPRVELSPKSKSSKAKVAGAGAGAASKNLLDRLPQLPHLSQFQHLHRPSKEEFLAAAGGFWARLKARFKWFTIRSGRPFNSDEIGALISWVLAGHVLWIILGTTTFVSLAVLTINTVFAQETLTKWIGNYLTRSSGLNVIFESAVVPKWNDGVISLNKVFVSRRPGKGKKGTVKKGSAQTAAAAAAAAALQDRDSGITTSDEDDGNYTQFDVSIETINITLSFTKWFNGKGLLRDVEVKGVRGVVDRTNVRPLDKPVDPKTLKHKHNTGDFELDTFKLEDLLVTIYQPNNFRPFSVSIYTADLPRLRKQWLLYDFLCANNASGSFDNSMFAIHPRQTHNYTGVPLVEGREEGDIVWKKHSRLRIDGLNLDHLNRGVSGPFSWIHEGNVDIVADVMIPGENDGSIAKVMSDVYDRVEATVSSSSPKQRIAAGQASEIAAGVEQSAEMQAVGAAANKNEQDDRFLVTDLRIHLNDVHASVPLFTQDVSYVSNALIRPIVAYINQRKTFIPINCRVVKRVSDFDGSWTLFDSGLMEDLSREVYQAFARDITDDHELRKRRIKKVGMWTLQLAAQALFIGLAGHIA